MTSPDTGAVRLGPRDPTDLLPLPAPELPEGVLVVRRGPGANCSSAGSAIDVLFYGSLFVGALAVALAAAFPPRAPKPEPDEPADDQR